MEIKVPHLAEGVDSGTVVSILVKEGDRVEKDQTVVELETKKAIAPIPSPSAGVVQKVHVKIGEEAAVGRTLFTLADGGKEKTLESKPSEKMAQSIPAPQKIRADEKIEKAPELPPGVLPAAAPTVKKLAKELGIDLRKVRGSERGGRIVMDDIRRYIEELERQSASSSPKSGKAPAPPVDFSKWGTISRKPLSQLRRAVGEKMAESWSAIPHVTQFDEADITAISALREKYAPSYQTAGARLTFFPFILKAVLAALKQYPQFNSSLDEAAGELILKSYYRIGVAVDTEAGLIVPVLRDADKKSVFELSRELDALAERTRQRKVSLEELSGGTFTISNLGSIGGKYFTPIINKPEVAILGVARGEWKPVWKGENVEKRLVLPLCLSYDHRVIDGADGARFIRRVTEALEQFDENELTLKS